ncbi:hypothetical protein BGLA2_2600011 [Burkholderia gladioli]|nr:hypothetical protein BGLA2_2600011 [Burkholderia gladioli]
MAGVAQRYLHDRRRRLRGLRLSLGRRWPQASALPRMHEKNAPPADPGGAFLLTGGQLATQSCGIVSMKVWRCDSFW